MVKSHAQQRRDGVAASLINAGIGLAYHDRSLTEIEGGAGLAEWIKGAGRAEVRGGMGITFIGEAAGAYDLALLTARGLHLSGVSCFVVPLRRLVKWLAAKDTPEGLDLALSADALFVLDFFQLYDKGECPLTGWQIQDVEVLLGDRLDGKRSVFLHSVRELEKATWWSGNLVKRVARVNREVKVKP